MENWSVFTPDRSLRFCDDVTLSHICFTSIGFIVIFESHYKRLMKLEYKDSSTFRASLVLCLEIAIMLIVFAQFCLLLVPSRLAKKII
jgi:hypothetical protein